MTKRGRAVRLLLGNVLVVVLLFTLLEGAASILFVTHEIATTPGIPERQHAEHDELLGWANRPNTSLPDYYGPGAGVRINGQGFRAAREFSRTVPAGKRRVVCSGDSFTFGYGVADEEAWCARLSALDPRLETINMGLGGYGVDQAYLWYRRDGTAFDHDVLLFAFLTDDFDRMRSDRFMGYGKPRLVVRNDSLFIANRPVPNTSWLTRRRALHGETLARLSVVRLGRKLLGDRPADPAVRERADAELRAVVAAIFADLRRINEAKGSQLVLAYLPGAWDYMGDGDTDAWRAWVQAEAARQDIAFLDLVEELRRLPPTGIDRLYAPNLHFSVAGNRWAADVLQRRLAGLLQF